MLTWIPLALIRSIVIMSQWDIILWELMPVQLFYKYTWSYWVYCTTTRNILYFKLLPVQASNASSLKKVENDDLYTQVQSPRVIQLLIIRGSNFKFRKSSGTRNRMKFISKSFFLVYRDDGCPADWMASTNASSSITDAQLQHWHRGGPPDYLVSTWSQTLIRTFTFYELFWTKWLDF